MENTNRPESRVKVIWEILPGDSEELHFREINQEDIDPDLFSQYPLIKPDNFPMIPHPLLNPAGECLDRIWNQTVIKINYPPSEEFDN